jgi:hypothetical protein
MMTNVKEEEEEVVEFAAFDYLRDDGRQRVRTVATTNFGEKQSRGYYYYYYEFPVHYCRQVYLVAV